MGKKSVKKNNQYVWMTLIVVLVIAILSVFIYGGNQGWFKSDITVSQDSPESTSDSIQNSNAGTKTEEPTTSENTPLKTEPTSEAADEEPIPPAEQTTTTTQTNTTNTTTTNNTTNETVADPIPDFCNDTDDQNWEIIGTTTLYENGVVSIIKVDECNGEGWIKEYYCDGTNIGEETIKCSGLAGCGEEGPGACLPLTCQDYCYWDFSYDRPIGVEWTEQQCIDAGEDPEGPINDYYYKFEPSVEISGCCCYTEFS